MNFAFAQDSDLCLIVNPHTEKTQKLVYSEENPGSYSTVGSYFIAVPTDENMLVFDTEQRVVTKATSLVLVPTPEQQTLKSSKASIRDLCAYFGSSTIRNAIRRSNMLRIGESGAYKFAEGPESAQGVSMINQMFAFRTNAATDLEVYPLGGLLCADDTAYAHANAQLLSPVYTGFDADEIVRYSSENVAVPQLSIPLEEEFYSLLNNLRPDDGSPALPVLVNVLKAINSKSMADNLHPQLRAKLGPHLDMRRLKFYAVLLALHCCANNCELLELCKCVRLPETKMKEMLRDVGIYCSNNVVFMSAAKFKGFPKKEGRPYRK